MIKGQRKRAGTSVKQESAFWQHKNAQELAEEQGVKPINDINKLLGHWPEGADFDSFFETAVKSRKHAETNSNN